MKLVLLFSLVLSLGVSAAAKKGSHTCRVLFLNAPANAPEKLHLFDGKTSREIELPSMNFSPVYKLAGGDLTIVLSSNSYSLPEEVDPKAPRAKIPAHVKDFYLLLSSDPKNPVAPVKMQIVPADDAGLKRGEMLWFNLTGNAVGGQVGKQRLMMKAKSKAVLKAPAVGNVDFNVKLAYRVPGDKFLHPLCETKWSHDPRAKMVVFVMSEEGSRTPRVKGFADFRAEQKKKPAQGG